MSSPENVSDALVITVFGPMQVRVQGVLLPPFRSRKALWTLALLTLRHNRPVEREWLAATLWPDLDQSQAFANLRPVLSELRRALGEQGARLQSPDRQTLLLELSDSDVDVVRFDKAIQSGSLPELEQAVALYSGPLLEGCQEEWIGQERASREQKCVQALQKLGEAALETGNFAEAVRFFQNAASLDPWSDAARRGWMEALAKNGDRNAALQVYREFLNILQSDPTAVPDGQTRALYERLRTEARQQANTSAAVKAEADPVPRVTIPRVTGYLPHVLTDLVGREDERLEVAACLRGSRLVTLTGIGGLGKTRLAMEVAKEVLQEYPDGVWLVALEALSEEKMVAQQIAAVLGLKEESGRSLLQSLKEHLRGKRLLLVLDNCEHLLEASAQAAAYLLRECADVHILATSREALGITGETAWAVPYLATPNPAHLPQAWSTLSRVLMGYESVQLFVERAQAIQKTFVLTKTNAPAVVQVCFRLEGIPLALELAAARIKALTVEQIALRLDNELGLLTGGSRTAQSRQQTLRSTLDWSYHLLNDQEKTLLRRLSVFAGGWTLEAAEQVCEGEDIQVLQILDLLTSLIDKSLIVFREREGGGRYHLLEMVRQYAAEHLQTSGECEGVKTRHRDWCLSVANEARSQLIEADQEAAILRFGTEYANLQASLQWDDGKGGEASTALQLAVAVWPFWSIRGYFSEGRTILERMLAREDAQEDTDARARALQRASSLATAQGDYISGDTLGKESLRIFRICGDNRNTAISLNNLGNSLVEQGHYVRAQAYYEESLALFKNPEYKPGIAWSLLNLGNVAINQGNYESARTFIEESLAIRRDIGDQSGVAFSLYTLGVAVSSQGDHAASKPLFEESLSISRKLGPRDIAGYCLKGLGDLAYAQSNYILAQSLYAESLRIFSEIVTRPGVAAGLSGLAAAMLALATPEKAVRLWGAATALIENTGARLPPSESQKCAHFVDQAHSVLGEEGYATALNQGRALTWEQAVAYALAEE